MNLTRRSDIAIRPARWIPLYIVLLGGLACAETLKLDEKPAQPGEWGYRPADASVSATDPPAGRQLKAGGLKWEIECVRVGGSPDSVYRVSDIEFNVHCPPKVFGPGQCTWRYRGIDKEGNRTNWSQSRTFTIAPDAAKMPLPARAELLARIPRTHP